MPNIQVTTIRKMRYKDVFIYVVNIGFVFQYLLSINGEIYQDYVVAKPTLLLNIKWRLGMVKTPYSFENIEELEKVLLSGAVNLIDKLIADGIMTRQFRRKKEKQIEDIEQDIRDRSGKPCAWRAIDTKQGFVWECLTHGMIVKMEDNIKPAHDILSPIQPNEEVSIT